jgi:hypothetical protein
LWSSSAASNHASLCYVQPPHKLFHLGHGAEVAVVAIAATAVAIDIRFWYIFIRADGSNVPPTSTSQEMVVI